MADPGQDVEDPPSPGQYTAHGDVSMLASFDPPQPKVLMGSAGPHRLEIPATPQSQNLPTPQNEPEASPLQRPKPVQKPDRPVTKTLDGKYYCSRGDCTEPVKEFVRKCEWTLVCPTKRPLETKLTGSAANIWTSMIDPTSVPSPAARSYQASHTPAAYFAINARSTSSTAGRRTLSTVPIRTASATRAGASHGWRI